MGNKIVNNVKGLKVNFSAELLDKLNNDWKLFEFNNSQIRLRYVTNSKLPVIFILKKFKFLQQYILVSKK